MPENWYQNLNPKQSIYKAMVEVKFVVPLSEDIEEEKSMASSLLNESLKLSPDLTFNVFQLDKIK